MSPVQYATFVIVILIIALLVVWLSKNPQSIRWGYGFAILLLSLHSFIFYSAIIIDDNFYNLHTIFGATLFSQWSYVLRIHEYVTLFALVYALYPIAGDTDDKFMDV